MTGRRAGVAGRPAAGLLLAVLAVGAFLIGSEEPAAAESEVEHCWGRGDPDDEGDGEDGDSDDGLGPPPGMVPRTIPDARRDGGSTPNWFYDVVMEGGGDDTSLLEEVNDMLAQSDMASGPAYICYLLDQRPVTSCASRDEVGHQFPPDMCWGSFPSHNYDIGYRSGGGTGLGPDLWGWLTQVTFSVGKWAVQIALWLVGWALRFDLMFFEPFAEAVSDAYEANLVEGLRLRDAAWLALVGWVGLAVLRGRMARGGGELLMAMGLLAVAAVLLSNSSGYMGGASDTMSELSNQVMYAAVEASDEEVATECDHRLRDGWESQLGPGASLDSSCERSAVFRSMQRQVHEVFVEEPHDHVNWGRPLGGDCETARDRILATGPHGSQRWPREYMRDAGCDEEAAFNASATPTRAMGGVLVMLVAGTLAVLLAGMAAVLLVAKTATALLFALAPLAAVGAILPGAGRRVAWGWLSTLFQALAAVVGVSIVLSLLLLAVPLTLGADTSGDLLVRWTLLLVFLVVLVIARRRLAGQLRRGMGNLQDRLGGLNSKPVDGPWPTAAAPASGSAGHSAALTTARREPVVAPRAGVDPAGPGQAPLGRRRLRLLGEDVQNRARQHLSALADTKGETERSRAPARPGPALAPAAAPAGALGPGAEAGRKSGLGDRDTTPGGQRSARPAHPVRSGLGSAAGPAVNPRAGQLRPERSSAGGSTYTGDGASAEPARPPAGAGTAAGLRSRPAAGPRQPNTSTPRTGQDAGRAPLRPASSPGARPTGPEGGASAPRSRNGHGDAAPPGRPAPVGGVPGLVGRRDGDGRAVSSDGTAARPGAGGRVDRPGPRPGQADRRGKPPRRPRLADGGDRESGG